MELDKQIEEWRRVFQEQGNIRAMTPVPASYNPEKHSVRMVIASEAPTAVIDWERWAIVDEVLLMDGMQLSDGRAQVPMLDSHSRYSIDDILGNARDFATVADKKEATLIFASVDRAKIAEALVAEGHLTDSSVGYRAVESIWIPQGEKAVVSGRTFQGPLKVTSRWELKELSLTPIGADVYAMVRSVRADSGILGALKAKGLPENATEPEFIEFLLREIKGVPAVRKAADEPTNSIITITEGKRTMQEEKKLPEADAQPTAEEIRKAERQRATDIEAIAAKMVGRITNINDIAREAITSGLSLKDFRGLVTEKIEDGKAIFADGSAGMNKKEERQYSLKNLIHGVASGKRDLAGKEMEISDALSKDVDLQGGTAFRHSPKATAVWVPFNVLHRSQQLTPDQIAFARAHGLLSKRDLNVGTSTAGGSLVGTNLLESEFIEYPRNVTLFEAMGARVLTGLAGNLDIPKKTGASSFSWVATEGNAVTESELTTSKVSMTPKIGGAFTDYTMKTLLQTTPAIDGLVQADLLETANVGIDLACFHGTNANGQPMGLVNQTGVGTVDGSNMGWDAVIEFLTDVMTGNALSGRLNFATNPTVWGFTQTREKWISTGQALCSDQNRMAGYPVNVTNQISAGHLFFGDFGQAIVAYWGGYMLLIDPYTAGSAGTTRVRVMAAVDVAIRLGAAFSIATNVS